LIEIARKRGRNGPRDAAAILLAYRHGLRASELCSLRWAQIDLRHGRLHVNRAKGGQESVHPLHGPELRALRPLQGTSPYVFVTEAGTPVTISLVPPNGATNWQGCEASVPNSSAHAATFHRLQASKSGRGHSIPCSLSGSQEPAINCEIYGASA
jgi:integrase